MGKKLLIGIGGIFSLLLILGSVGAYWISGFSTSEAELQKLRATQPGEINYLQNSLKENRGKILLLGVYRKWF
jgi:hypothetical protein